MAVILAVNMLVIGIFGSYQTAQAAEIVAGYTALEVIEGILLSFGISIFTTEMVSTLTEDPKTAQDEYWRETQAAHWAEYMEAAYEEERKKGGGGSGPTPTPGVTGSDIPSFKEVIQNMKNTGKIVLGAAAGAGVWECMSKAVSSLWDKIMDNDKQIHSDEKNPFLYENLVGHVKDTVATTYGYSVINEYYIYNDNRSLCTNCAITVSSSGEYRFEFLDDKSNVVKGNRYYIRMNSYHPELAEKEVQQNYSLICDSLYGRYSGEIKGSLICDYNIYVPYTINGTKHNANLKPLSKEEIWVHPDLQDTYKNNGKLEYPQQAPQPLQIPSIAQLTDLANKLKTNPQQSPNSVQELIDQLKQNPQPQPTVAPNPNPNPNPNPDPNPEVTPKPDDTTTDVNPDDYKADLRLVFPFCIPFDLVHLIQAFEAEPEAPVFEFPLDLELENPWTGKKILDYHHVFKLDMSDYEPVIKIFRIFEIIFFIIGLLMITRQQMIKG